MQHKILLTRSIINNVPSLLFLRLVKKKIDFILFVKLYRYLQQVIC
jgi:hypothetical protein